MVCVDWCPLMRVPTFEDGKASLLLFSALSLPQFRSIKLRTRKPSCPACGVDGQKIGQIEDIDYLQFCGGERPNWEQRGLESGNSRIGVQVVYPFSTRDHLHSLDKKRSLLL